MSDVSRETSELLEKYHNLVKLWNPRINLVAASTIDEFERRHIKDCLQLADLAGDISGHWVDLGSGGGLPGIVLATVYRQNAVRFTFVESDKRKGEFLRSALRELGLKNTKIVSDRIEKIDPLAADYVSARALAALPGLLNHVHRHMAPSGVAWLMKGRTWRQECQDARQTWQFELQDFPSTTDPDAAILKISGVSYA